MHASNSELGSKWILQNTDLSPRIRILMAIANGYKSVRKIARATDVSTATVSKWINVLATAGLLVANEHDIYPTEQALRLLEDLVSSLKEELEIMRGVVRGADAGGETGGEDTGEGGS